MSKTRVSVIHRDSIPGTPGEYDEESLRVVYGMLKEAVDAVGGMRSVIKAGDKVVVRANACWAVKPDSGIAADPRVVEALMRLIRDETRPKEVVVADRSSIGADTAESFEVTGIKAAALRGGRIGCCPWSRIVGSRSRCLTPWSSSDPFTFPRPCSMPMFSSISPR